MFGSLLVSGMMRKGLFIFIIAGKVACYCKRVGENNRRRRHKKRWREARDELGGGR